MKLMFSKQKMKELPREIWIMILEIKSRNAVKERIKKIYRTIRKDVLERKLLFPKNITLGINCDLDIWQISNHIWWSKRKSNGRIIKHRIGSFSVVIVNGIVQGIV